ncbi:hypothetical protein GEMRC1_009628 [Eukaryota sp. GEM-RC1]
MNVFKTLSAIIVGPSFHGRLDMKHISPILNEIFTVFNFIHHSFEVVCKKTSSISSFLYRVCVGEIDFKETDVSGYKLPNDENQKLFETVFHCNDLECSVHHYETQYPKFLFPCFPLRNGSFDFCDTDAVGICNNLEYDYVLNHDSFSQSLSTVGDQSTTNISISQLGVAILPIDPDSRFDLFVPSTSFNCYVPVEVHTREDPSYADIYSKFDSLEKASHHLYRDEAGGKCMIIVNYVPRIYEQSTIARPRTNDFVLQLNGESLYAPTIAGQLDIPIDRGASFRLSPSPDSHYVSSSERETPRRLRLSTDADVKREKRIEETFQ